MAGFEDEIFEISDFTVVTDWEKLMLELETAIHEWQMNALPQKLAPFPKGCLENAKWAKKVSDKISFGALHFTIQHHKLVLDDEKKALSHKSGPKSCSLLGIQKHCPPLIRDLLDVNWDFPPVSDVHSIARIFGLREFAVLCPVGKSDFVINENKRNAIMSCLHMALASTNCDMPFFLLVEDVKRGLLSGVCQNTNIRTTFETVHLKYAPPKGKHLAGILDIFKEKVACPVVTPPPVKVSVKVVYGLEEGFESQWSQLPPDIQDTPSSSQLLSDTFPLGTFQDPISDIRLSVKWPSVNEDMVVENDIYSDLDPTSAPFWALAVAFQTGMECMMNGKLREFCDLRKETGTVDEILGIQDGAKEAESALGRLTEPPVARVVGSVPGVGGGRGVQEHFPLDDTAMEHLLEKIFAQRNSSPLNPEMSQPETPPLTTLGSGVSQDPFSPVTPGKLVSVRRRTSSLSTPDTPGGAEQSLLQLKESLLNAKAAPLDGLAGRLAMTLSHVLSSVQGVGAVCQLWRETVLTIRDFWDRAETLPGVGKEQPNMGMCLLDQKLSMLQSCIQAKQKIRSLKESVNQRLQRTDSDSSLEFFDCQEATPQSSNEEMSGREPEGRLEHHQGLTLIHHPSEPLFVPITQDPSPMTEDMLEEEVEMMSKLGSSLHASTQRSNMQIDALLSDMQAFKAANPKSCLEDLVRWHSPRDWIEDSGHLSPRMETPGNLWKETWKRATPLPVTRQKRLFNESKEAEKILHWLGSLSVAELCFLNLPCLFSAALSQLCSEAKDVFPLISDKLVTLCERFIATTRQPPHIDDYLDLLGLVSWIEMTVSQFRSIRSRLAGTSRFQKERKMKESEVQNFVLTLMGKCEAPILGGSNSPMGHIIADLFRCDVRVKSEAVEGEHQERRAGNFPPHLLKEYILRWFVPRPAHYSRPSPQKMYAYVHLDNEFRLSGAFSQDITFM